MPLVEGFPPVCGDQAKILILGSMPSVASIRQQQYYAHPRNAFWPIMEALFGRELPGWQEKVCLLKSEKIALWDVLRSCSRDGSLDSSIKTQSIVTNDFDGLLHSQPGIGHLFFNGAKAEQVYRKQVLPGLASGFATIPMTRLPSTSPAHASLGFEQKVSAWRVILDALQTRSPTRNQQ